MTYLSGPGDAFEKAISGGWQASRTEQLKVLVAAVKKYISMPTADNIRAVHHYYEAWKYQRTAEFQVRGEHIDAAFEAELMREYKKRNIPFGGDAGPEEGAEIAVAPAAAINRWTTAKRGATMGLAAASIGITAAQTATGASLTTVAEGLILGTGVALSATGVGLIAAGVALTITTSALSATSAWKSKRHRDNLKDIYTGRDRKPFGEDSACRSLGITPKTQEACVQHRMIANHVLPYVIAKKDAKFKRKTFAAVPFLGSLETVRAAGKKAYKYAHGTLGANRRNAAGWLACHLISCDCLLVQAIVSELYSVGEMEWLKGQDYASVIGYLEMKLKST